MFLGLKAVGLVSSICLISGAMGCRDVEQIYATPQLKTLQGAQALVPPGGQALSPSQTTVPDRHPLGSVTRFSEALQAYSLPTERCSVAPLESQGQASWERKEFLKIPKAHLELESGVVNRSLPPGKQ